MAQEVLYEFLFKRTLEDLDQLSDLAPWEMKDQVRFARSALLQARPRPQDWKVYSPAQLWPEKESPEGAKTPSEEKDSIWSAQGTSIRFSTAGNGQITDSGISVDTQAPSSHDPVPGVEKKKDFQGRWTTRDGYVAIVAAWNYISGEKFRWDVEGNAIDARHDFDLMNRYRPGKQYR